MLVIGVAGGTGSGKSTVVRKIMESFPAHSIAVLPQDSYYKDAGHLPLEERSNINFDHPDSVDFDLMNKHLEDLRSGFSIAQPVYSYITCLRSDETVVVEPSEVIIVEGILIFTHKELLEKIDLKVFVDADADDRLLRVIKRDIVKRGRSLEKVIERYEKVLKPMHLHYIEPSKYWADIIIPHGGKNPMAIDILVKYIEEKLN